MRDERRNAHLDQRLRCAGQSFREILRVVIEQDPELPVSFFRKAFVLREMRSAPMKFLKLAFPCLAMCFFSSPVIASLVYIPSHFEPSTAKMIVVIHGCLQSAESMALGTGWNQIADRNNLAVLYPQVPEGTHPLGCWGWYLPENQRRDSGQLKGIADEIKSTVKTLKLKAPDIYLAGLSSGAATVGGLLACYPKMFKAGALHSGPSYGLAQTLQDADRVLRDGPGVGAVRAPCHPRDFGGSILVIQGDADKVVNPQNGLRVISDFLGTAVAVSKSEENEQGRAYAVSDYRSEGSATGRLVMVKGLGHAWSGSVANLRFAALLGPKGQIPTTVPFFSEQGPSATNMMWEFFLKKSR